uniref:hypothetical protein n=1 Tax=uncultured Draconibacterium sp. TaxID=1573823 RepID=UPI003217C9E3
MALIQCPECENQISSHAQNCPHCGYPIQKKTVEWDIRETKEPTYKTKKKFSSFGRLVLLFIITITVLIVLDKTSTDEPKNYMDTLTTEKDVAYKIKYTTSFLNLRKDANSNSKILKTFKPNTALKTKGQELGGFSLILDSKTSKVLGWCASKYLQDSPLSQKQLEALKKEQLEAHNNQPKEQKNDNPRSTYNDRSLAYKLAILDKDGYITEEDQLVKRFEYLLNSLNNKYTDTKSQIGDRTVVGWEQLKSSGINASLLEIMEGMNTLRDPSKSIKSYHEYLFIYLIVRKELVSHNNTMKDYQASLNVAGIESLLKEAGIK